MFGGSEPDLEAASSVAGSELRAATRLFRHFFENSVSVGVPIMANLDCGGRRLVAMNLLPLSTNSSWLVMGSRDAGKTVCNDIVELHDHMQKVGKSLHLRGHQVGQSHLFVGGDVEGHVNNHGQLFLLDLARTYPPESPQATPHLERSNASIFHRLMRPEFLLALKASNRPPLISDALSVWGKHAPLHQHRDVHNACVLLVEKVIPKLAAHLQERQRADCIDAALIERIVEFVCTHCAEAEAPPDVAHTLTRKLSLTCSNGEQLWRSVCAALHVPSSSVLGRNSMHMPLWLHQSFNAFHRDVQLS
jgi:hypothetical protein